MQSDWLNSALSLVVYGDIAPSIDTQYNFLSWRIFHLLKNSNVKIVLKMMKNLHKFLKQN